MDKEKFAFIGIRGQFHPSQRAINLKLTMEDDARFLAITVSLLFFLLIIYIHI